MRKHQKKMYWLLLFIVTLITSASNLWASGADVNSLLIGNQVSMQENLDVSYYRNSNPIRYA
jgi:hypothetical protein